MQLRTELETEGALSEQGEHAHAGKGLRRAEPHSQPFRLAVLTSHVIQYQDPLFGMLAAEPDIDLTVLFCSDWGMVSYRDPGFGTEVRWDLEKLGQGYHFQVLRNWSLRPDVSRFWGLVNPGVASLAAGKFDALWVHGWSNCTSWIAMLAAFAARVPVLMRAENHLLCPPNSRFREGFKRKLLNSVFSRIAGFLAIGSLNADFYRAYGVPGRRIFEVPYCVDNEKFMSRAAELCPARNAIRAQMGIEAEAPVVLFSGKLIPRKAPMDLLLAFQNTVSVCPAHLIFLGDGELARELKAYVAHQNIPNVHFAGFRNQSELSEFFVAADMFVLPSHFERWGLVVNEALCFGLPVIAADQVGAVADLVQHGVNGFRFPAGDVKSLGECLLELLLNPCLRISMSQKSRERIQEWNFQADIQGIRACLRTLGDSSPVART